MPTSSLARYEVLVSNLNSESRYTLLQGHDRKSGKAVTINTWALSNSVSSTLFENEKAAYQRLSSARCESLCPILEIFESESTAFVVMEQKTMTLQEFVSGSCPQGLPKKVIQSIFREICEAVRTLHHNGIAHLDLHPENIYLDQDLQAYLAHFGCAHVSHERKRSSRRRTCPSRFRAEPMLGRRGSLSYSSVEMFESPEYYDPYRSDVYSLGALLHYMSTGEAPHIEKQILDGPPERDLSAYLSRFSSVSMHDLVTQMMQTNPLDRPGLDEILAHSVLYHRPPRRNSVSLPFRRGVSACKISQKSRWKSSLQSFRELNS